jgi:flagellar hook capping protein FlgD
MRRSLSRGWAPALAICVLLLACSGATPVSAQCPITGPNSVCAGPATLCAPSGPYEYQWTGPSGFYDGSQCITVSVPGTYTLTMWDGNTGLWTEPCSRTLVGPGSTACSIDGPTTGCAGQTVSLCGPSGAFTYAWTGPGGFTSSAACVSVGAGGTYQLVVTDPATGCSSNPCTHDVTFSTAPTPCAITGPASGCAGQTVSLCGPSGAFTYAWTGPAGFTSSAACVSVGVGGTYQLFVTDPATGCPSAPCTHDVTFPTAPTPCAITGPASGCTGQTVSLCGPSGSFTYAWTGPGGFTSSAACVSVGAGGTYQLLVTDPATGCSSAPCTHDVTFTTCGTPIAVNCPRPAWYWRHQCAQSDRHGRDLTGEQLASLAACVDARSRTFTWSNAVDGLCSTMRLPLHGNLRARAKRQFAVVVANVCAGSQGLSTKDGVHIGLDAGTAVHLDDLSTTIGAWLADADQRLLTLEASPVDRRSVRDAYRDIIRAGWMISHGRGIGSVCGNDDQDDAHAVATFAASSAAAAGIVGETDESLASELAIETGAALSIESVAPNPFSSQANIAYVLSSETSEDVQISIYDLSGRLVRELVRARQTPGRYDAQWDGRSDDGQSVRGGMYFIRGRAGTQPIQTRVTLLR